MDNENIKNEKNENTEKENKQAISIGGLMVKKMIEAYERSLRGEN